MFNLCIDFWLLSTFFGNNFPKTQLNALKKIPNFFSVIFLLFQSSEAPKKGLLKNRKETFLTISIDDVVRMIDLQVSESYEKISGNWSNMLCKNRVSWIKIMDQDTPRWICIILNFKCYEIILCVKTLVIKPWWKYFLLFIYNHKVFPILFKRIFCPSLLWIFKEKGMILNECWVDAMTYYWTFHWILSNMIFFVKDPKRISIFKEEEAVEIKKIEMLYN